MAAISRIPKGTKTDENHAERSEGIQFWDRSAILEGTQQFYCGNDELGHGGGRPNDLRI